MPLILNMKLNTHNQRLAVIGAIILGGLALIGWLMICWSEPAAAAEVLKAAVTH